MTDFRTAIDNKGAELVLDRRKPLNHGLIMIASATLDLKLDTHDYISCKICAESSNFQ